MKNKKLNLSELKVKSFVTDFESGKENTIKGGSNGDTCGSCTAIPETQNKNASFLICD